jgi:hypothetical protein
MIRRCGDVSHYGKGGGKHVWIVVDGVTIDITADQFDDVDNTAIVVRCSLWHENLPIIKERPWAIDSDDACYERYVKLPIYTVYKQVLLPYINPPGLDDGSRAIPEDRR